MMWRFFRGFVERSQEVRVHQTSDRHGNTYWQAYNPITGDALISGSENEVRVWIEEQNH